MVIRHDRDPLGGRLGPGQPPPGPGAAEIAALFRDLRRHLRISLPDLAQRLGTRMEIIAALEAGDVRSLPPWPDTAPLVTLYAGMVGLDPRPVLGLIHHEMSLFVRSPEETPATRSRASRVFAAVGSRLRMTGRRRGPEPVERTAEPVRRREAGSERRPARWIVAGVVAVLLFGDVALGVTGTLQDPVARVWAKSWRSAEDYVRFQMAPVRDGLRWIEVDDPRSRRGDLLERAKPSKPAP